MEFKQFVLFVSILIFLITSTIIHNTAVAVDTEEQTDKHKQSTQLLLQLKKSAKHGRISHHRIKIGEQLSLNSIQKLKQKLQQTTHESPTKNEYIYYVKKGVKVEIHKKDHIINSLCYTNKLLKEITKFEVETSLGTPSKTFTGLGLSYYTLGKYTLEISFDVHSLYNQVDHVSIYLSSPIQFPEYPEPENKLLAPGSD